MKVYIVWFTNSYGDDELVEILDTEEGAKRFIEERKTLGNEGLHSQEYDVMG